ncbi:hypothetical protein Ccrd_020100 [Cynara cardunculus var. scolymus]|uniref:Exonuclease domain-containing protein n=1 Tax=Cynara cardunculus var. scolymus TaxID=59895 RepID=A0A103Y320_CYNCS|nr:hypothetical protein Ccrd_020100 [Cynara cardunculus var. scolymus]
MGRSPGNGGPSFRFNQAEIETSEASHLKNSRLKNLKQLNPNWAQLCQKLGYGSELSSKKSGKEIQETILGKRKERSDKDEANENEMNALTPTSSDSRCDRHGLRNGWSQPSRKQKRSWKSDLAKDFRVVQKEVAELLKGKILVGHALRNDLKALLLSHPKKDIRDTAEYQPFLKEGRSKALRHLAAEVLSVKIQSGEHCPIEDARAAMMLYMKKKREWEKNVKDIVKMKLKQKKRKPKKRKKEGSLAS